jgi:predicted nucleotidyltransferase
MTGGDAVTVFKAERRHTLDELAHLARRPLEAAGALRAVAFGAYARGTADGYSDLDLVVVLETADPFVERWKLLRGVLDALPLPVDLLVYTPEEFERGIARGTGIFAVLGSEGVTIYARP